MNIRNSAHPVPLLVVFLLILIAGAANAGGLYLYELGGPEVGLAGAGWAARAQDAAVVITNPAGMSRLDHSELMVGAQPLYLSVDFTPDQNTGPDGGSGDASDWLPAGGMYYVHPITPDIRLGMAMAGYFGLGLDYGDNWAGRYYLEEIKLQTLAFQPALSYRVNQRFSLGLGISALYGVLEKKAAVNNLEPGLPDGKMELDANDWTCQFNTGVLFEPADGTRFGLTYMSEADLEFDDNPEFSGLGDGLSAILGSGGFLDSRIDLEMTMPQSVMFSGYHEITDRLAIMGNLGWQDWSEFGMVGVSVSAEEVASLTYDRNYKDTWHAAFGVQYRFSEPWLVSAGVGYDSAMVDEEDMTPDLPIGRSVAVRTGRAIRLVRAVEHRLRLPAFMDGRP